MNTYQNHVLFLSSIIIGLLYTNCNLRNVRIPFGGNIVEATIQQKGSVDKSCSQFNFGVIKPPEPIIETNIDLEKMIISLDSAWATAILEKDVAQLDLLLADDLIYGHASGVLDTKSSYIEKVASGKQVYKSLIQKNVRVRLLGNDAAVTHSWMHVTGTNPEGTFDDKVMMLHVWTKRDNAWKLVGHQTAKVDTIPM